MNLLDQVICVFADSAAGKHEPALLHACMAIDATAKRLYPSVNGVGARFIRCVRDCYWLVEPMVGTGINVEQVFIVPPPKVPGGSGEPAAD
jgi:hypothetical protein